MCSRGGHPHVRVWRVAHPSADCDALELTGQNIEHGPARDECGRAERDRQLIARAIVVAARLLGTLRDVIAYSVVTLGGESS